MVNEDNLIEILCDEIILNDLDNLLLNQEEKKIIRDFNINNVYYNKNDNIIYFSCYGYSSSVNKNEIIKYDYTSFVTIKFVTINSVPLGIIFNDLLVKCESMI